MWRVIVIACLFAGVCWGQPNAFDLGGVGYLSVDDSSLTDTDGFTEMTCSVFVYVVNAVTGAGLFDKYNTLLNQRSWRATMAAPSSGLQPVQLQFGGASGTYVAGVLTDSGHISEGAWHHVAWTYTASNVDVYIDGVEVASTTTGTLPSSLFNTEEDLKFGRRADGYNLDGTMSDPRIYNRALSAEEIAHLASMGCSTNGINTAYDPDFGDVYLVTDGSAIYSGDGRADDVPRDGLVSEWLFTSDATDSEGANDGTLNGGATATGALALDGSGDHVLVSYSADFDWGTATDFSFSMWVKSSFLGAQRVLAKRDSDNTLPIWNVVLDTQIDWRVNDSSNTADAFGTVTVNDGDWHHVVCTADRDGDISIYVDGDFDVSDSMSSVGDLSTTGDLYIGRLGTGEISPYTGSIDSIRVYNRTLSESEIAQLYKEGIPTHSGSLVLNAHAFTPIGESATATDLTGHQTLSVSGTVDAVSSELRFVGSLAEGWKLTPYRPDGTDWMPQSDGLVAMYRMGKNGTFDDVVSTNNGTAYGDAVATLGTGGEFDGTGDYVSIPHNENHWAGTSFSQSCWFKSTSANIQIMLEKYNNSATSGEDLSASFRGYGFRLNAGKTQIYMGDTLTEVSAISTATYNDGSWHLAVWTYDGAGLNLYTDGFLVDSTYTTLTPTPTTENLRIGGDYPEQTNRYFTGTIDETAIWSTALTAQDVARLYSTQKGKYP